MQLNGDKLYIIVMLDGMQKFIVENLSFEIVDKSKYLLLFLRSIFQNQILFLLFFNYLG